MIELTREEMQAYSAKIKEVNEMRSEDYRQFINLLIKWVDFTNLENRKEKCYINLWAINNFIEDFECKVIQSTGERKISAENHLKTLYDIQAQYGTFYFESIVYRDKIKQQQSDIIAMSKKITELTKELNTIKKINEF